MKPMTPFPVKTRVRLGNLPSAWSNGPACVDILGQCDCDCASDCACAPEENSRPIELPFKNHEKVLKILCNADKRYVLIDAPAGYGKSRLLAEAQKKLIEQGYQCSYIDLRRYNSKDSIREKIRQDFGFDFSRASDHDAALRGELLNIPSAFALLLDAIESDKEGKLIGWFYETIAQPLGESRNADYKIVLTGRHVWVTGNPYEWHNWRAVALSKHRLPAIQPDHIREILDTYAGTDRIKPKTTETIAKNMARLSGGHPGIISKLVDYWLANRRGERFEPGQVNLQDIWNRCAEEEFKRMMTGLNLEEQSLLRSISIFRQMTPELLETLCQKIDITNYQTAWSQLTSKHIFIKGDVFWQDGVVRQVVTRRLELTENDEYRRLHSIALELWEEYLRGLTEQGQRVNALRNVLYHAINGGMTKQAIAQRVVDNLRAIYALSDEQRLALYQEAEFKEEDLDDEHRWFEYLEIRHKERPTIQEIEQLLKQDAAPTTAPSSPLTGESSMELKIESNLLNALARILDFLRQNAENVLIERWEKRNQGKASTPPVFKYSREADAKAREQEIKQSLQALPAIPDNIRLSNEKTVLLNAQHLQNLQQTMLNAQDSIGRLGAELAKLTSAEERARLNQQIDGYKQQFNDAAAELAEIYVHLYSPK